MKRTNPIREGAIALVTGGSSGIGLSVARLLTKRGCNVWIMARNQQRLRAAFELLEKDRLNPAQKLGILEADVSDPAQVAAAIRTLEQAAGTPDLVIHSAGITYPGYVRDLDVQTYHELMNINYFGAVHVTKAVLPGMIRRGSGYFAFISSYVSLIPFFGYSGYCASKCAMDAFASILRQEAKSHGIGVSVIYPVDAETPQLELDKKLRPPEVTFIVSKLLSTNSPDFVAQKILSGISRRKYQVLWGVDNKFLVFLKRLLGEDIANQVIDLVFGYAQRKLHSSNLNGG